MHTSTQSSSDVHETDVANIGWRKVLSILSLFIGLGAVIHFGLALMEHHFAKNEANADRKARAQHVTEQAARGRPNFPDPKLQLTEAKDLAALRLAENKELESYGWVNQTAGVVRIPIQRAMEILVQRGLPVRTAQSNEASELELLRQRRK